MRSFRQYLMCFLTLAVYGCVLSINSCTEKRAEIIKIGAMLPLSGDAAQYGEWGKNGISLAADEINSKGGINGNKIEVVYEDDAADPKKGVSAVNKLISIDKVNVLIGPIPSAVTLAIAPICEKNEVVVLSSSSNPTITHSGDYIFRNWPSDDFEGLAMAQYAIKMKFNRIAVFHINNEYGLGIAKVFKEQYLKLGGSVLITETFMQGSSDMRSLLTKIRSYNPDAIYLIGHTKENGHIVKQARDMDIKSQILGTVGIEGTDFLNIADERAEGVIYTAPAFDPDSQYPEVKTYQDAYIIKYGRKSEIFAATAYDALNIIALMIQKYGNDPDKIKAGLYALKNYPGVSGVTSFDENGDVVKPVIFKTVKNKQYIIIKE